MIWLVRRAKAGIGMLSFGRSYGVVWLGTAGMVRQSGFRWIPVGLLRRVTVFCV